jgi:hypothetical protein
VEKVEESARVAETEVAACGRGTPCLLEESMQVWMAALAYCVHCTYAYHTIHEASPPEAEDELDLRKEVEPAIKHTGPHERGASFSNTHRIRTWDIVAKSCAGAITGAAA